MSTPDKTYPTQHVGGTILVVMMEVDPARLATALHPDRLRPVSPALFQKATGGQIFRMGVWGGKNGTLFPHFDEITKAEEAASDHAAIVAEIDL